MNKNNERNIDTTYDSSDGNVMNEGPRALAYMQSQYGAPCHYFILHWNTNGEHRCCVTGSLVYYSSPQPIPALISCDFLVVLRSWLTRFSSKLRSNTYVCSKVHKHCGVTGIDSCKCTKPRIEHSATLTPLLPLLEFSSQRQNNKIRNSFARVLSLHTL